MRRQPLPELPSGVSVGSHRTYAAAQRAVDFLSDNKFPVENVSIVGSDLKLVERVTGRLTQGRAMGIGAGGGAWWGLFVGILLSLFTPSGGNAVVVIVLAIVIGLVFGVLFGWIGYRATGGRRDFTSMTQVVASTYEVLCRPDHAEEARHLLARLALQTGEL